MFSMSESMSSAKSLKQLYFEAANDRSARAATAITELTAQDFERGAEEWHGIPALVEEELMHRLFDRCGLNADEAGHRRAQELVQSLMLTSPVRHRFVGSSASGEEMKERWDTLVAELGEPIVCSLIR